jgi:hypothetical protein
MGPLATSQLTVEVTGGPQCGYGNTAGEVDLVGGPDLAAALGHLAGLHSDTGSIDLGGVAFAGSSLLSFLARVSTTMPAHTPLLVW